MLTGPRLFFFVLMPIETLSQVDDVHFCALPVSELA